MARQTIELNDVDLEVLRAVQNYMVRHGYGPSLRDIAQETGHNSTSWVRAHLQRLVQAGKILVDDRIARSITLTEEGRANG